MVPKERLIFRPQAYYDKMYLKELDRIEQEKSTNTDSQSDTSESGAQISNASEEQNYTPVQNRHKRSRVARGSEWTPYGYSYLRTWKLSAPYVDVDRVLLRSTQEQEIKLGLATWERASNLCFTHAPNNYGVNLDVAFTTGKFFWIVLKDVRYKNLLWFVRRKGFYTVEHGRLVLGL